MPNVNVELDDEEHEQLERVKDAHGLTWRGLLLQGAKSLDGVVRKTLRFRYSDGKVVKDDEGDQIMVFDETPTGVGEPIYVGPIEDLK